MKLEINNGMEKRQIYVGASLSLSLSDMILSLLHCPVLKRHQFVLTDALQDGNKKRERVVMLQWLRIYSGTPQMSGFLSHS